MNCNTPEGQAALTAIEALSTHLELELARIRALFLLVGDVSDREFIETVWDESLGDRIGEPIQ